MTTTKKWQLDPKMLEELPFEGLMLQCTQDKYKLSYAAIRWAKEIKQKESLPDPVPTLVPRAMRELLSGKVTLKEIEALPILAPAPAPVAAAPVPSTPTITLKETPDEDAPADKADDEEDAE